MTPPHGGSGRNARYSTRSRSALSAACECVCQGCTAPAYARFVVTQASIEYYLALDRSDRPRTYLFGPSPDDERELWYFEAVDDNGALIAIRQLTIGADGTRHAYSPQHIEDEWGFLADQPIDCADELTPCDATQFRQIWEAR